VKSEDSLPRVHESPHLDAVLSEINQIHIITSYLLESILMLYYRLRLGLVRSLFPLGFPSKTLLHFLRSSMLVEFYATISSQNRVFWTSFSADSKYQIIIIDIC
jgi:hypothetical protein